MPALFVNHLTVIDFSYVHPVRGILGESWIVDVILDGELDDQGMVFDFGHVKKQVRDAVENLFDHKLVIGNALPGLEVSESKTDAHILWANTAGQKYQLKSPTQAIFRPAVSEITPTTLEPLVQQAAQDAVPANVRGVNITLRTESISGPAYQYSHGLKKHAGDCQRIAHGHRSRIKILRNGKRDPLLEKAWALKWQDIYIGSREDLKEEFSHSGTSYLCFGYQAQQGYFELSLPSNKVYLIESDSTVECIADHIAAQLKAENPGDKFEVHAYEGVMKGAIAHR